MITLELPFVHQLAQSLRAKDPLIQIVLGPRQVGKTTGVKQLLQKYPENQCLYFSADGAISHAPSWLIDKWYTAKSDSKVKLLIIDEIQNIENWSATIKQLWDEQVDENKPLKVILLGSSSLSIQKGLQESLAGRFQVHQVFHWNFEESKEAYNLSFEEFLTFGGYPGSYRFIKKPDEWVSYIKHSIIDPVIGKDILSQTRVKSPALFKQCFEIATSYPAQEISYTKLLGQLQDRGNTDLVKHYLQNFEGAFLLKELFKYTNKPALTRSSSPKLLPMCPALYTINLDAQLNATERGRSFECVVGAALQRFPGNVYYWRERNYEIDFIYKYGKKLIGIEVKSGAIKSTKGLEKFKAKFPASKLIIITPDNLHQLKELLC
jgi:predicted AAA+ superfamily ATPase